MMVVLSAFVESLLIPRLRGVTRAWEQLMAITIFFFPQGSGASSSQTKAENHELTSGTAPKMSQRAKHRRDKGYNEAVKTRSITRTGSAKKLGNAISSMAHNREIPCGAKAVSKTCL